MINVGLIQSACSADPEENLKKTLAAAESAAGKGAQIICTQELFRSQYFCQSEDHNFFQLAEPIPGPTTDAFQKLAQKRQVVVVASLFEKRAAGVYHNTAIIIDADRMLQDRLNILAFARFMKHGEAGVLACGKIFDVFFGDKHPFTQIPAGLIEMLTQFFDITGPWSLRVHRKTGCYGHHDRHEQS